MVNLNKFRIRILYSYPIMGEEIIDNLSWSDAVEKFKFYVSCCLEFPELNVRCVNIMKGKKSIRMYTNH